MDLMSIADKVQAVIYLGDQCLVQCALVIQADEIDIDKLMVAIESCQEGIEQLVRIAKNNASKLSHAMFTKVKDMAVQCYDAMLTTQDDLSWMESGLFDEDVATRLANMTARIQLEDVGPLTVSILMSKRPVDESSIDLSEFELSCDPEQKVPVSRSKKEQSPNRYELLGHIPARAPPVLYLDKLTVQADRELETNSERWVDLNLMRRWIQQCDQHHMDHCSLSVDTQKIFQQKPKWLIDVDKKCLVSGHGVQNYLTLSYVWGDVARLFRLDRRILDSMLDEGYLAQPEVTERLPQTIIDSVHLTQLLGQQYLWVDCMCIVHDDEIEFKEQLEAMGSIYANSYLTIVATTGDSDAGLRGIEGTTTPFDRANTSAVSFRGAVEQHHGEILKTAWHSRGWTFQEQTLSRRIIVLSPSDVSWECHCAVWFEGMDPIEGQCGAVDHITHEGPAKVSSASLQEFARHIYVYNMRDLRFSDDIVRAFVGILTTLETQFGRGFACGLPVAYFDIALLWRNTGGLSKRFLTPGELEDRLPLPTWSWMLWKGTLLLDCWTKEHHEQTRSLVGWSYKIDLGKQWIPLTKDPQANRTHWHTDVSSLGWQLRECPIYLRASPRRAFFYIMKKPAGVTYYSPTDSLIHAMSTIEGTLAGYLAAVRYGVHKPGTVCEVVAISETDLAMDFTIGTTPVPESERYLISADTGSSGNVWLNVLWIEWYKGVAHRKGVGQVSRLVWEQEELLNRVELIEMVLG